MAPSIGSWFALVACACIVATVSGQVEQVHIASTAVATEMQVSWATTSEASGSIVQYGLSADALTLTAMGSNTTYTWGLYKSPLLHTATMSGLQLGTRYYYRCGDADLWSEVFSFVTQPSLPPTPTSPLRALVIGDNGHSVNSVAVQAAMRSWHDKNNASFLLHAGDLSYADLFEHIWDLWGNQIEPLAAQLSYLAAPGNHELLDEFLGMKARFPMPAGGDSPLFWSVDYSVVHIIALDSESPEFLHFDKQYRWLSADLAKVDRTVTPWIVVFFHNPWYCSNAKHENSAWAMRQSYEDLLNRHSVDLVVTGHVHAYERTFPIDSNGTVSDDGIMYVTTGHGGNHEGLYPNWEPTPVWSAFHEGTYFGFCSLEIHNSTSLLWQMMDTHGQVQDSYWLNRPFPRRVSQMAVVPEPVVLNLQD